MAKHREDNAIGGYRYQYGPITFYPYADDAGDGEDKIQVQHHGMRIADLSRKDVAELVGLLCAFENID